MYGVATECAYNIYRKQIIIQPNSILSRISRLAVKQGARPTIPFQVVVKKRTTEKTDYFNWVPVIWVQVNWVQVIWGHFKKTGSNLGPLLKY